MKTKPNASSRSVTARLLVFAAVGAYFAVLFVGGLLNGGKMSVIHPDFIIYFNPLTYSLAWLVVAGILAAYGMISKPMVYGFTWLASLAYALRTAASGGSYYLTFAMCGLVAVMTLVCGRALRTEAGKQASCSLSPAGGRIAVVTLAVLAGGWALFLLLSSYLRYTVSPTVSTSLYIQLTESLRSGFSFDTTLEFGESVSHMAAHISPIFLVYLPFYALIPSPVTLLVLQTLAVYSAVIPLWLIARRKGLSPWLSVLVCGLLCCLPAVWGGAAGSLHEYALLLPLLLWLLWALEARRRVLPWIFGALILCVRETCAIHLLTVGLYWLAANRRSAGEDISHKADRLRGGILAGVSLLYFVVAMAVLTYVGKGTLITRFENVTGQYGTFFSSLIRELIFNPAIILYEMLAEAKLHYVLCMLLPLGLLPLFSRKKAGLIFLLPFLLLNLLADFPYHYNLDYPYSFGVSALALYLCTEALAVLSEKPDKALLLKRLAVFSVCFTLILGAFRVAEFAPFTEYALNGGAESSAMTRLLESVEEDASVSASGRLLSSLAAREEIYPLSREAETDFVVLDLRDEWSIPSESKYTVEHFEKQGYTVVASADGIGVVLQKKA